MPEPTRSDEQPAVESPPHPPTREQPHLVRLPGRLRARARSDAHARCRPA